MIFGIVILDKDIVVLAEHQVLCTASTKDAALLGWSLLKRIGET